MAFWITCHMKAKREQKKAEQIVIKLFSRNYARDIIFKIAIIFNNAYPYRKQKSKIMVEGIISEKSIKINENVIQEKERGRTVGTSVNKIQNGNIVIYGLSTEGYEIAKKILQNQTRVIIIDA